MLNTHTSAVVLASVLSPPHSGMPTPQHCALPSPAVSNGFMVLAHPIPTGGQHWDEASECPALMHPFGLVLLNPCSCILGSGAALQVGFSSRW